MTKFSLPKSESLILVNAELIGPTGSIIVTLALDTGCTRTVIQPGYLRAIGYVPERDGKPLQVLTASKLEKAYSLKVKGFSALGRAAGLSYKKLTSLVSKLNMVIVTFKKCESIRLLSPVCP